jgi:hypothetical protein
MGTAALQVIDLYELFLAYHDAGWYALYFYFVITI